MSLYIFTKDNRFRQRITKIVDHPKFEIFMIFLIFVSSIMLAWDLPLNEPNGLTVQIIETVNTAFSFIFMFEAIMKIVAYGFLLNGDASYLKTSWNVLDFLIVILSIIELVATFKTYFGGDSGSTDTSIFKVVRMVKVLKPLRSINKFPGLKIVIESLLRSIPGISNVLLICLIFFFIFGIICVSQFKGGLHECRMNALGGYDDAYWSERSITITTKYDCLNFGGQWLPGDSNFDNIGEAIKLLFTMAITVGWQKQMYMTIQSRGVNLTRDPSVHPNDRQILTIFFILYMIVCSFFILNLFVGVVIT